MITYYYYLLCLDKLSAFWIFIDSSVVESCSTSVLWFSWDEVVADLDVADWLYEGAVVALDYWDEPLAVLWVSQEGFYHAVVPEVGLAGLGFETALQLLEGEGEISLERKVETEIKNFLNIEEGTVFIVLMISRCRLVTTLLYSR